jgi:hypothetical protein
VRAVLGRNDEEDDLRGARAGPVLSHQAWSQRFGRDPRVIGRTLRVNGIPYDVIGVMPEGFRGLMVGAPDFWAPLSLLGEVQPTLAGRDDSIELDVVGRLRPGTSREAALAQLIAWDSRRAADPASSRKSRCPAVGTIPSRWRR